MKVAIMNLNKINLFLVLSQILRLDEKLFPVLLDEKLSIHLFRTTYNIIKYSLYLWYA